MTNPPLAISRRAFVARTAAVAATAATLPLGAAEAGTEFKAVIIGHTGRGNYGHDMDTALTGVPGVSLAAVADPDAKGRAAAAERSKAARQYSDYREMLDKDKPNLVVVAPRWSDDHLPMCMAAINAGAHILTEKPFTSTPAEADEILGAAKRRNLRIAVAHQMRLAPSVVHLKKVLNDGLIGDLLAIRSWGKQDARAGGEDMMVLGTHLFDMMRLLAGDPQWCMATVRSSGHDISKADARRVSEQIGPVAGDEIDAHFGFSKGVIATFTSRGKLRTALGHWGMELLGSKGSVRLFMDVSPTALLHKPSQWQAAGFSEQLVPVPDDPSVQFTAAQRGFGPANRRVVDDWLAAIKENREPACSGYNAMKAVEMVMAVYESALAKSRVALPLKNRTHPLA